MFFYKLGLELWIPEISPGPLIVCNIRLKQMNKKPFFIETKKTCFLSIFFIFFQKIAANTNLHCTFRFIIPYWYPVPSTLINGSTWVYPDDKGETNVLFLLLAGSQGGQAHIQLTVHQIYINYTQELAHCASDMQTLIILRVISMCIR